MKKYHTYQYWISLLLFCTRIFLFLGFAVVLATKASISTVHTLLNYFFCEDEHGVCKMNSFLSHFDYSSILRWAQTVPWKSQTWMAYFRKLLEWAIQFFHFANVHCKYDTFFFESKFHEYCTNTALTLSNSHHLNKKNEVSSVISEGWLQCYWIRICRHLSCLYHLKAISLNFNFWYYYSSLCSQFWEIALESLFRFLVVSENNIFQGKPNFSK